MLRTLALQTSSCINTLHGSRVFTPYFRSFVGRKNVLRGSYFSTATPPFHACIVGSGPSGFYTCESILTKYPNAHITIFERLPIPFGLIRYGVAPDHPEVKLVQNKFEELLRNNPSSCSFVGNINVGEDISIPELQQLYHAVILAYGSASERTLGIPGEDIKGVYSARNFVAWLNGHPDFQKEDFDLGTSTQAVVIGQGNVALDVARMLLRSTKELQTTDITNVAVQRLSSSKIREVHILGRRGPIQAAFTTKEFRELLALPNVEAYPTTKRDGSMLPTTDALVNLDRPKRRLLDLIMKLRTAPPQINSDEKKRLYFHFFRRPVAFFKQSSPSGGTALGGVKLELTKLSAEGSDVGTSEYIDLKCGVAFRSIGYKAVKMPDVPFDDAKGIVPNELGRVTRTITEKHAAPAQNLYVAGWLKRGPSGIIATNKWDAEETVQSVLFDWEQGMGTQQQAKLGVVGVHPLLTTKGVRAVSYAEWKKIDDEERRRGKEQGKPLDKITVISDMLDIITRSK